MTLYKQIGFKENPFLKSTAEEETKYLKDIFSEPNYYKSLKEEVQNGNSKIIFGERGIGKSALMYKMFDDLRTENVLQVLIDRYDDIPLKTNDIDFLKMIIRKITDELCIELTKNRIQVNKLSKYQREELATYISMFFRKKSKKEFYDTYDVATQYKYKNVLKNVYNKFLCSIVNSVLSGSVEIVSDSVNKSLGLPNNSKEFIVKKYIPEMKIESINAMDVKDIKLTYAQYKDILDGLIKISDKIGYKSVVVYFDKIDEYKAINSSIDKIVLFVKDILLDTHLIYIESLSLVFMLWSRVYSQLNNSNVRYDKLKPKDITWEKDQLRTIMNKRLQYFSTNQESSVQYYDIFESKESGDLVLSCASRSPRDLITILGSIYDEQVNSGVAGLKFTNENVKLGISKFIDNYDFNSIYPKQTGASLNAESLIEKLKKLEKVEFGISDIKRVTGQSQQACTSHLTLMANYGFIKEIPNPDDGRTKLYRTIDPIVRLLIERNQYGV